MLSISARICFELFGESHKLHDAILLNTLEPLCKIQNLQIWKQTTLADLHRNWHTKPENRYIILISCIHVNKTQILILRKWFINVNRCLFPSLYRGISRCFSWVFFFRDFNCIWNISYELRNAAVQMQSHKYVVSTHELCTQTLLVMGGMLLRYPTFPKL